MTINKSMKKWNENKISRRSVDNKKWKAMQSEAANLNVELEIEKRTSLGSRKSWNAI